MMSSFVCDQQGRAIVLALAFELSNKVHVPQEREELLHQYD